MRTILEILKLSTDYLQQKNIEGARRQAEELLGEALGLGRMGLYLEHNKPLTESELSKCRDWLKRRGQGEPLQYITGSLDFFGCRLKVTSDVLIPRQETEILVDMIAKELSSSDLTGKILWDVCCGSGCIGIALKKKFPALKIILSDISEKALAVAKENAADNAVDVEFICGDMLAPFIHIGAKADFVVCNPPYISAADYEILEIEVKNYEPKSALVAGASGLEYYTRLGNDLPKALTPGGKTWLEIGDRQGMKIKEIFSASCWTRACCQLDWSGRERFFSLEIE
jgi:release factor glutamine methyltransferase